MKIEAVLLDCDGLMFNTEVLSQKMWFDEAAKYHTAIPDGFFTLITGARRDEDALNAFPKTAHLDEVCAVMQKKRFDLSYWTSFPPDGLNKKGLLDLYHYLHENRYKAAVCSSSTCRYINALLSTVSQPLHFDCIVGGDMVSHGKPDPEIFLKASDLLQVRPENCLVLEDSKQGILAARAGGMHSCFIQDTIIPDEEMRQAVEFQKDSLIGVIDLLKEGERNAI